MKRLSIALLTATIGVSGVTVGAAEVCGVDFKEVIRKEVKAIQAWNLKHPAYVKAHHLDRDMSANTRRMKERARKALEVMCAQADGIVGGIDSPVVGVLQHSEMDLPGAEGYGSVSLEEKPLTGMISKVDYPLYDNPSRSYTDDSGYGPGYSWFGGGGYVGGRPSAPPVTPPVMTPVPEPSGLALSAVPMLALMAARKRK